MWFNLGSDNTCSRRRGVSFPRASPGIDRPSLEKINLDGVPKIECISRSVDRLLAPVLLNFPSMKNLQYKTKIIDTFYGDISVYWDMVKKQEVAVKSFSLSSKDPRSKSIMTEFNLMVKLKNKGGHENIVCLLDAIQEPSKIYLVKEYFVMGDLCTYLETHDSLRPSTTAAIFRQIVSGVSFLHSNGYAHRKLALDNVLIDSGNAICKLCDFGSVVPANQLCSTSTGRKRYLAPEVTNASYHPCEADVWSLGIILFALLTGRFLFKRAKKGYPAYDYFYRYGLATLVKKYQLSHRIPQPAMDLLEWLLKVDPALRLHISDVMDHPFLSKKTLSRKKRFTFAAEDMLG